MEFDHKRSSNNSKDSKSNTQQADLIQHTNLNGLSRMNILQFQQTIGNRALSKLLNLNHKPVQMKWVDKGKGLQWEDQWNARLMYKQPIEKEESAEDDMNEDMIEEPEMPKVLKWDGEKYEPSEASFNSDVFPAASEKAATYLDNLKQWHNWSIEHKLTDSKDIIPQIIDVIISKEEGVMVMAVNNGKFLRGISVYESNGTTEGYPAIDDEDSYWYVMFSAAHPATQLPRNIRGKGNDGGVGSALNAAYDGLMDGTGLPIYRHAANPTSYISLLRAGYIDVNAEKDGFEVPKVN